MHSRFLFTFLFFPLAAAGPIHGAALHKWLFNDPSGTPLHQAANAVQPANTWTQALGNSTTTGSGVFRIRQEVGSVLSRLDTGHDGEGGLHASITIAGWNLSEFQGPNPRLNIAFMNGPAAQQPTEITAEVIFSRSPSGMVSLQPVASGSGATLAAPTPLFPMVQNQTVTIALSFNRDLRKYSIHYREGVFGDWNLLFSGATGTGRLATSVRLQAAGDFVGLGGNFLDIDRFTLTTEAPYENEANSFLLNETRVESQSTWSVADVRLLIGSGPGQSGHLRIEQGGVVENFPRLSLGHGAADAGGTITLSGNGLLKAPSEAVVIVGDAGTGAVTVGDQAVFSSAFTLLGNAAGAFGSISADGENATLDSRGGDTWIGMEAGSEGSVLLWEDAKWENAGNLRVGQMGVGHLRVESGARVRQVSALTVGAAPGGEGLLEIHGEGSRLEASGDASIGPVPPASRARGTLSLDDQATMQVAGKINARSGGVIRIDGGARLTAVGGIEFFNGSRLELTEGHLVTNGDLRAAPGVEWVWTGGTLQSSGILTGIGDLPAGGSLVMTADASRLSGDYETPLRLGHGSVIQGPGTIFNPVDLGDSATALLRGTNSARPLRVIGRVTGSGTLQFVELNGELRPGNDNPGLVYLNNSTFVSGTTIHLDIAGPDDVSRIAHTTQVSFANARLRVRFTNGYEPTADETFTLFTMPGWPVSSPVFADARFPAGWELEDGVLRHTGRVPAQTYGSWARAHALTGPDAAPLADWNGNGSPNLRDYLFGGHPRESRPANASPAIGENGLTLTWNRPAGGGGDYFIESTADLLSWTEVDTPEPEPVLPADGVPGGYERVAVTLPAGGENAAFHRVSATEFPRDTVYPGAQWETIPNPAEAGVPQSVINEALAYLNNLDTTGFVAVKGGRILFEYGDTRDLSYVASVRKSILSMMFGKYVEAGVVDLTETIGEIGITDRQALLEIEKRATVHDLLRARSGVYHPPSNTGDNSDNAPPRGSRAPGQHYLYNNWDFNALGTVFTTKTGKTPYEAIRDDLAIPLQMQDFSMAAQSWGGNTSISLHRAYHFTLSTRDMARIGLLMLRDGVWKGERLIPESWMEESLFPWTPGASGNRAYSYLWWVREVDEEDPFHGSFAAHGLRGQYIMIVPKRDLVLAHKTNFSGTSRSVSRSQFYQLANILVQGMEP